MTEAADRVRHIVEHLPEVVWLLDGDLTEILYANPAYRRLLGSLSIETTWPLDTVGLVHPGDAEKARDWVETIQQDVGAGTWKREYSFEARLPGERDNERHLETIGVPVVEDGAVIGFAGISADVTDQTLREQELESTIDQLDQFVSVVTHDIRNPLTVAKANLELYEATRSGEHLEQIDDALDRIDDSRPTSSPWPEVVMTR